MIRKFFQAGNVEPLGERQVRVIASTADVDRMGDVVVQSGVQLANFFANPIVLYQHDPSTPIGRANAVRITPAGLEMTIDFAPAGISAKADEVCGLVKSGILIGISIGFDPLEIEPMNPAYPRGPQRYLKCDLMEVSIVSIPANPSAAVIAKRFQTRNHAPRGKGLVDLGQVAVILESLGFVQARARIEAALEGDGSKLPAQLAEVMQDLGAALVAMTAEEVAEAVADAQGSSGQEGDLGDLDRADVAVVLAATSPLARRFRAALCRAKAGGFRLKSGRRISGATADVLRESLARHEKGMAVHREAMKEHRGTSAALQGLLEGGEPAEPDAAKRAPVVVVKTQAERKALAAQLREKGGERYPSHMLGDSPAHYAARHAFDEMRRRSW
jgi:HK97 family phage prohead protease